MPSGRPASSRQGLTWPLLILAGLFALFVGVVIAFYFAPHPELLFSDGKAAKADFTRTRTLTMEDVSLTVPRPYVAHVDSSIFGPVRRISLRLPWPYESQRPMSDAEAGDITRILAIDIVSRTDTMPDSERLARVYPVYFKDNGEEVGADLVRHAFKPGTPYQDTALYVGRNDGSAEPVLMSCSLEGETAVPPLCERRLNLSAKVSAIYRFHEEHMMDWREIDATVTRLMSEFRPGLH